jgi:hypothetical protein
MINFLKRKKSTIHSIVIPDFGLEKVKEDESIIQWMNPEQTIALSINYFNSKPDIPSLKRMESIRGFYREQVTEHNGGLIQVEFSELKTHQAIRTIFKIPQKPSGMIYLASLTIPFSNCSYVIKIQAPENGVTGMRDTVVANKLIKNGEVSIGKDGYENWSSDPYDSNYDKGTLMNKSEDPMYDVDFENHPLSKARKMLSQIETDIEFKAEIEKLRSFNR